MVKTFSGRALVSGSAEGRAVVSRQPISFWGGLNPATGEITDRRHDRSGVVVTGKVFVFPHGKGSSTASSILLEAIRAGTAPAAIINHKASAMLALGAIVAEELYRKTIPIVVLPMKQFRAIREGDHIVIEPDGSVLISRHPSHR